MEEDSDDEMDETQIPLDQIPDNEIPQVNYVIFTHGETLPNTFMIPSYLGPPYHIPKVLTVAFPVNIFSTLRGDGNISDLASICNADDVPAEESRTGDIIHDMELTGGLDPRYSFGIYKCIKYNGIPSRSELVHGMNDPAYQGLLSKVINSIFAYHAYTHPAFDFRRITVYACRDIGDPFALIQKMKTQTVDDDLANALSGLTMGGNTRRRRSRGRRSRGRGRSRRSRGRSRRGRSKKTKK
jgi:hypothetical protein